MSGHNKAYRFVETLFYIVQDRGGAKDFMKGRGEGKWGRGEGGSRYEL